MDNFSVKRVVLLNADDTLPDDIYLSQSDANGRKLSIQLTDNSVISDTTGYSLKLVFTTDKEYSYDFVDVDLSIGLYEITYPSELRKTLGDVNCEIWICNESKITATKSFAVNVGKSVITGETIVADDEFTTLQNMIIAVQGLETNYAPRLNQAEADIIKLNSDLETQIKQITNAYPVIKLPISKLELVKNKIVPPPEFDFATLPFELYKNGMGEITTDFDIANYKYVGNGKAYYVDVVNGHNGTDYDGSITEPFGTIRYAMTKPDANIIYVRSGIYQHYQGFEGMEVNKNISIIGYGETSPIITTGKSFVGWTKTGGYTNVYQISTPGYENLIKEIIDLSIADGEGFLEYNIKASILEVDNNNASYFIDSNYILYIHTKDNRIADINILCLLDLCNFRSTGDYSRYVENLTFVGGKEGAALLIPFSPDGNSTFYAKNCKFLHTTRGIDAGGVAIRGVESILQDCIISKNCADGIGYQTYFSTNCENGRVSLGIEINCKSSYNGINGLSQYSGTYNGSTAHSGCKVVRINGEYHNNEGPNIAEIYPNTQSWNVGCNSHDSNAISDSRNINYINEDNAKMWLDSCIGYSSKIQIAHDTTSKIYIKNCAFDDGTQNGEIINY